MALINCPECQAEMSSEALACPRCGKPNVLVANKKQNGSQAMGCLLMVLSIGVGLVVPIAGTVMFIVGLVVVLLNTRLK